MSIRHVNTSAGHDVDDCPHVRQAYYYAVRNWWHCSFERWHLYNWISMFSVLLKTQSLCKAYYLLNRKRPDDVTSRNAMPCHDTRHATRQHDTMPRHAMPRHGTPRHVTLCRVMWRRVTTRHGTTRPDMTRLDTTYMTVSLHGMCAKYNFVRNISGHFKSDVIELNLNSYIVHKDPQTGLFEARRQTAQHVIRMTAVIGHQSPTNTHNIIIIWTRLSIHGRKVPRQEL